MLRRIFRVVPGLIPKQTYFKVNQRSFASTNDSFDEILREHSDAVRVLVDPVGDTSNAPKCCRGCGVPLQSVDPNKVGYVDQKAVENFRDGQRQRYGGVRGIPVESVPDNVNVIKRDSKTHRFKVSLLYCKRCFRLQNFRRMSTNINQGSSFIALPPSPAKKDIVSAVRDVVRSIPRHSVVVKVVDLMDLESSIVPELFNDLRSKQVPVIWAVNKTDCLPTGTDVAAVKDWVRRMVRQVRNSPLADVVMVSAATGLGMDDLERRLQAHLDPSNPRGVYFVGRENSGKSTLLNRFLHSIQYSHLGSLNVKQARGGVTSSSLPGTTLANITVKLPKGFTMVDTPGIPAEGHMAARMTTLDDLDALVPRRRLRPISFALKPGKSLFLGGCARIDNVGQDAAVMTILVPDRVSLHIASTVKAADFMRRKVAAYLAPPSTKDAFRALQPFVRHRIDVHGESWRAWDDISVAGLGWVAVTGWGKREFDVWVPKGVRVFRRPAMLPYEASKKGAIKPWRGACGRGRSPHMRARRVKLAESLAQEEVQRALQAQLLEEKEADWMGGATFSRVPGHGDEAEGAGVLLPSKLQVLMAESSEDIRARLEGVPEGKEEEVILQMRQEASRLSSLVAEGRREILLEALKNPFEQTLIDLGTIEAQGSDDESSEDEEGV